MEITLLSYVRKHTCKHANSITQHISTTAVSINTAAHRSTPHPLASTNLLAHRVEVIPGQRGGVQLDAHLEGLLAVEQLVGDESLDLLGQERVGPQGQRAAVFEVMQDCAEQAVEAQGGGAADGGVSESCRGTKEKGSAT